jgi:hypothetical protein
LIVERNWSGSRKMWSPRATQSTRRAALLPFIVDKQVVAVGDGVVECEAAAAVMLRCALVAGSASWRRLDTHVNKAEATET